MSTSSTSAERARCEELIASFYVRIGRSAPRFMWFDDPMSCVLARHLLRSFSWLMPRADMRLVSFKRPVGGRVPNGLWTQLDRQLSLELDAVRPHPGAAAALDSGFFAWFWSSFWSQLEPQVGSILGENLRRVLDRFFQRDPRRVNQIDIPSGFWGDVAGTATAHSGEHAHAVTALAQLQSACGWWLPCMNTALCASEPCFITVDANGLLHNEHGPALHLSAAHHVYAWHGTRVPSAWVERRATLERSAVLSWQDREQREAAARVIGWADLIADLPQRILDADRDPEIGTLFECSLPISGLCRFLRVRCGTGREFVLSVPLEMTSARQANAWTYGLTSEEYQPEVRA